MKRWRVAVAVGMAVSGAAGSARADDEANRRIAQALFDEGRSLMDAGRYGEACPKLAESQRLDPGGGTLLNLAICREREGKTATAWTAFHDAATQAKKDGRSDREKIAEDHIAALSSKLTRLRVKVAPEAKSTEGLAITVDGDALPAGAWDTAIPVDPGTHKIAANAPGHVKYEADVAATTNGSTVDAVVPPLEIAVAADALGLSGNVVTMPAAGETKMNPAYTGIVIGTAVAMTVSTVTGTLWLIQHLANGIGSYSSSGSCIEARGFCPTQEKIDSISSEHTMAMISTVTLGLSVVGVVAMFVVPARVKVTASRGGAGLGVTF